MTASLGCEAPGSGSRGAGEPSLDRLSGVWAPLEWADSTPAWLGEAGALLKPERRQGFLKVKHARAALFNTCILQKGVSLVCCP